jgi:lysophospholipase L1-like esterase
MKYTLLATSLILLTSCSTPTDAGKTSSTYPEPLGEVVYLGDSITAGYIAGGWTQQTLESSYSVLLAKRFYGDDGVGTDAQAKFRIPMMATPGIFVPAVLNGMTQVGTYANGTPVRMPQITPPGAYNQVALMPQNAGLSAPYHLLAVPGYKMIDIVERQSIFNRLGDVNPLFNFTLRDKGTALAQAKRLNPDTVFLWAGNNEALGSATSGGTVAPFPVESSADVPGFRSLLGTVLSELASPDRRIVLMNVPDVTAIPAVNTVGFIAADGRRKLILDLDGDTVWSDTLTFYGKRADGSVRAVVQGEYVLLNYLLTNRAASGHGLSASAPLENNEWLDAAEIASIQTAIGQYNQVLQQAISAYPNVMLIDMNAFFSTIAEEGYRFPGGTVTYTSAFPEGGLFSLDGVHPTERGHRVIANKILSELNTRLSLNLPLYNDSPARNVYFARTPFTTTIID